MKNFSPEYCGMARCAAVAAVLTWTVMLMLLKACLRSSSSTPLGMLLRCSVALGG